MPIRRIRRRAETTIEPTGEPDRRAPAGSGPHEVAASRELTEAIAECTGRLIESRRVVVQLYLLGHDPNEIAQLTGSGKKRVSNLLFRGLSDLRVCLSKKGFEP